MNKDLREFSERIASKLTVEELETFRKFLHQAADNLESLLVQNRRLQREIRKLQKKVGSSH